MIIIRAISRFVIGVTFILSGFLKAMDPVGGALKIDEYLKAFHLGFLDFISMPFAVLLACMEFLIGVCVLKGIKMRFFSTASLIFTSFFTLLTLYSAIFNPVQDCGCFGEAIHLSNWQTFYKNIVLLAFALIICFQRDKFKPIAAHIWEKIYITAYTSFIFAIITYALIFLPQIDFGQFKPGTDLMAELDSSAQPEYQSTFIYSKDGIEREFTLENLPDSTWNFIETRTIISNGSESDAGTLNFIVRDSQGQDVTHHIIGTNQPTFLLSIYNPDKLEMRKMESINRLGDSLAASGALLYLLNGTSEEIGGAAYPVFQTDYKTAIALNRSNCGITYLNDGIIAKKWSANSYPFTKIGKILSEDAEILTANVIMKEQLFAELCIVIILFMILIVRFISKRVYFKYLSGKVMETSAEQNGNEQK